MANLTAPDESTQVQTAVQTEERQQLESRFKLALRNFGTAFQLPPTPEPPPNLFTRNGSTEMTPEDRRAIWELQQDMAVINQRHQYGKNLIEGSEDKGEA